MTSSSSAGAPGETTQRSNGLRVDLEPLLKVFSEVEYQNLRRRILQTMQATIPSNAVVLVAGKSDDALLKMETHRAWHFPLSETGCHAGYRLVDCSAVASHLDESVLWTKKKRETLT